MDVSIEQSCPSCGAGIILSEADRLIKCTFCDVNNYMVGSVAGRFLLPAVPSEHYDERDLFYAPYLRFKGSVFYVQDTEVKYKIVDATRAGTRGGAFPVSLGLRPQAMKVKSVVSDTAGVFIQQTIKTKTVFADAVKIVDLFSLKKTKSVFHRAFIGETLSRIYQPYYLKNGKVFDAVDGRRVDDGLQIVNLLKKTCSSKVSWEPQFISTHCPDCGGLLDGERDSLVLHCKNCESLWQEENRRFTPVSWAVVESLTPSAVNMPVWRISFKSTTYSLETFGDYLRFTNQPVVVRKEYDSRPLVFLIPAFKINPKLFLRVASHLTVAQPRIPDGKVRSLVNPHPVTLHPKEAVQFLKSVLAATTLNRRKRFPLLPAMNLKATECSLLYLPFDVQSHDLVQQHTQIPINKSAVKYGRSL